MEETKNALEEEEEDEEVEIYEVGGCVRDSLLGTPSSDIDYVVVVKKKKDNKNVEDAYGRMVKWIRAQGYHIFLETPACFTVRAKRGREPTADFVLARREVYMDENSRRPSSCLVGSLKDDLARRDFTVNALARRIPSGAVIDLHGGLADLEARVLRTPLDPFKTFSDDPLRMLRALRFVVQKNFVLEAKTEAALADPVLLERLKRMVSPERVRSELQKMFESNSFAALQLLSKWPALAKVLLQDHQIYLKPTLC